MSISNNSNLDCSRCPVKMIENRFRNWCRNRYAPHPLLLVSTQTNLSVITSAGNFAKNNLQDAARRVQVNAAPWWRSPGNPRVVLVGCKWKTCPKRCHHLSYHTQHWKRATHLKKLNKNTPLSYSCCCCCCFSAKRVIARPAQVEVTFDHTKSRKAMSTTRSHPFPCARQPPLPTKWIHPLSLSQPSGWHKKIKPCTYLLVIAMFSNVATLRIKNTDCCEVHTQFLCRNWRRRYQNVF